MDNMQKERIVGKVNNAIHSVVKELGSSVSHEDLAEVFKTFCTAWLTTGAKLVDDKVGYINQVKQNVLGEVILQSPNENIKDKLQRLSEGEIPAECVSMTNMLTMLAYSMVDGEENIPADVKDAAKYMVIVGVVVNFLEICHNRKELIGLFRNVLDKLEKEYK